MVMFIYLILGRLVTFTLFGNMKNDMVSVRQIISVRGKVLVNTSGAETIRRENV